MASNNSSNNTKQLKKTNSKSNSQERSDLVAYWSVLLLDGVHTIELEHGTSTGKRVIRVDGKEIIRKDWMFKLVGDEKFSVGKEEAKCELHIDPIPHFAFSYSLFVDGKPLEKFSEKQNEKIRSWSVLEDGKRYRIVFDKQTLDVWVNGHTVETENEFVENGTEMKFVIGNSTATIKNTSSGAKKEGVINQLVINEKLIDEDTFD